MARVLAIIGLVLSVLFVASAGNAQYVGNSGYAAGTPQDTAWWEMDLAVTEANAAVRACDGAKWAAADEKFLQARRAFIAAGGTSHYPSPLLYPKPCEQPKPAAATGLRGASPGRIFVGVTAGVGVGYANFLFSDGSTGNFGTSGVEIGPAAEARWVVDLGRSRYVFDYDDCDPDNDYDWYDNEDCWYIPGASYSTRVG
ncbi:MAG: hypothetical protein ABSC37_00245 [Xanthobacteraceae bacterium]